MMKQRNVIICLVFILIIVFSQVTCKRPKKEMVVTTGEITNISSNSAEASGVTVDLGEGASQKGHCYSKTPNANISNQKTQFAVSVTGNYTSQLTNLEPGTTYYINAYLSTGAETVYGDEKTFTTLSLSIPILTTTDVSSITSGGAISGGNITSDGGSSVTARGVCWSTAAYPTTSDTKTTDGTGSGVFSSTLTGLTQATIYHIRTYATNSIGTGYGPDVTFSTQTIVVPTVSTTSVSAIAFTTATSGGNVSADGGATVSARGVCWSTLVNPTITDNKTADGSGTGVFSSNLTGLTNGILYHIRSYATNSAGTAYGTDISFTSLAIVAPTVTTNSISGLTTTTASSGGNVTSDGGASVIAKGVCWTTTANPTIADAKTSNGTGLGSFSSSLTGLSPVTTYHLRAYATNSEGTAYGSDVTFTTQAVVAPTVTTTSMSAISTKSATSGGNVTADGGASVTARGVCWSTVINPTISDSKTSDGSATGAYSSSLTGLTPMTTYHVRAYAINSAGTNYGSDITFTTSPVSIPTVTTTSASAISATTATSGGNVTSDGGTVVTARGVCWSLATNPSIADTKSSDGAGTSTFVSSMTVLSPVTTYHVRAYATNSSGTAYGSDITFTTTAFLVPTLTTTSVSSIGTSSAVSGGNVTNDGGAPVTARGLCWSTSANPTILNSKSSDGTGTGSFVSNIAALTPGTTYHVRAYASNSIGTGYGSDLTFTTGNIVVPSVTTTTVSAVSYTTATSGGNITSDGGASIIAKGVCWSTVANPTITDPKTSDGVGTGSFASNITGLSSGALYHARAYATNSIGTSYGADVTFTTSTIVVPTLSTTTATAISATAATSGGNITSDGGSTVSARGVCWSTTSNPTITDSKTTDGIGIGSFTSNLAGLSGGTTYYIRSYATNGIGTGYGAQVSFVTLKALATLTTKDITGISAMGGTSGGIITSTGGGTISAKGVCWGELSNPTLADNVINSGTGPAPFNSSIITAIPGTTYYIRAYATNEIGTSYGDLKTFSALSNANYFGFESGMLPLGWSGQWSVSNEIAFQSNYSLKSLAGASSDAILTINLSNSGQISFYYYLHNDNLDFYIDNVKVGNYPASPGWNQVVFDVTSGVHTFKWHYNAESYASCYGNIDYIILPL